MLGGQWDKNAGSYALALGAIPSKRVPDLVNTLTERFVKERAGADETFQAWCHRVGKKELKTIVDQFDAKNAPAPGPSVDPSFYTDWGDVRQYVMDVATGECAGEVVTMADFGFTAAETEAFEAQLLLDEGKFQEADNRAYEAMLRAAHTLVRLEHPDASAEPKAVVEEFKRRFVDTKIFWHRQHMNQFSNYLVNRHENGPDPRFTRDTASKLVEEANLFIDAAHQAHAAWQQKMNLLNPAAAAVTPAGAANPLVTA